MTAPIANETAAAGPACPAAKPGKTNIPAPIMVPVPIVTAPTKPIVRSSSPSATLSPLAGTITANERTADKDGCETGLFSCTAQWPANDTSEVVIDESCGDPSSSRR